MHEDGYAVFLPGSKRIICAAVNEKTGSHIVDLETEREVSFLPGACSSYQISPDASRLVCGQTSPDLPGALWDIANPAMPRQMDSFHGCLGEFSQDNRWFAIFNLDTRKTELWDLRDGKKSSEMDGELTNVLFSPNSRYVGIYTLWNGPDESFRLIDLHTGTVLWRRPFPTRGPMGSGPPTLITYPAFTHDSRFVIIPGMNAPFDVVFARPDNS